MGHRSTLSRLLGLPPIVAGLRHAFMGFPGDKRWETGANLAIKEIYKGSGLQDRLNRTKVNVTKGKTHTVLAV